MSNLETKPSFFLAETLLWLRLGVSKTRRLFTSLICGCFFDNLLRRKISLEK
jgi:hypothetical protein